MVTKQTLDQQVSDWVWSNILERKITSKAVITDTEVALQTGVSRSTARVALSRLVEERGLLRKVHGGWGIRPMSAADAIEMYGLRSVLECMAVEILCGLIDDFGRRELQQALARLIIELQSNDRKRIAEADLGLHKKIVELTKHKRLIYHYQQVLQSTLAYVMLTNSRMSGANAMIDAHTQLVKAISDRNVLLATRLVKEHLRIAQNFVTERIGNSTSEIA